MVTTVLGLQRVGGKSMSRIRGGSNPMSRKLSQKQIARKPKDLLRLHAQLIRAAERGRRRGGSRGGERIAWHNSNQKTKKITAVHLNENSLGGPSRGGEKFTRPGLRTHRPQPPTRFTKSKRQAWYFDLGCKAKKECGWF